tara:strand:- start:984 stop:1241 length:258 start_codon:yes stop_codon:yes gene_type:complete
MSWKNEIKKDTTATKTINNFIMFINNTNGYELVKILFGQPYEDMEDHRKQYVKKFMGASTDELWGMLDEEKRQLLVDASIDRYGR